MAEGRANAKGRPRIASQREWAGEEPPIARAQAGEGRGQSVPSTHESRVHWVTHPLLPERMRRHSKVYPRFCWANAWVNSCFAQRLGESPSPLVNRTVSFMYFIVYCYSVCVCVCVCVILRAAARVRIAACFWVESDRLWISKCSAAIPPASCVGLRMVPRHARRSILPSPSLVAYARGLRAPAPSPPP